MNDVVYLAGLWDDCYVANSEAEAWAQADRQLDRVRGKEVWIDRCDIWDFHPRWDFTLSDDHGDLFLDVPLRVRVVGSAGEIGGWDGEVLYPEWRVVPLPGQAIISTCGQVIPVEAVGVLTTTAPGIGTAEGFGPTPRPLIYPEAAR